jgi:hypothetical protein
MPDATHKRSVRAVNPSSPPEVVKVQPKSFAGWERQVAQTSERDRKKSALQAQLAGFQEEAEYIKSLPREQQQGLLFRTESAIANITNMLKEYD